MHGFDFEIQNLNLKKGVRTILENISCSILSNKLTVIIGANGAGKSSLLRCLAVLEKSYEGEVFLGAKNLRQCTQKDRTRMLAWSSAESRLAFSYSCLEVVC